MARRTASTCPGEVLTKSEAHKSEDGLATTQFRYILRRGSTELAEVLRRGASFTLKGGHHGRTIILWDWTDTVCVFFMFLVQKGKQKKINRGQQSNFLSVGKDGLK